MSRILITGGAGFVGCNLADYFLKKGHDVTVFDNLFRKNVEKNIGWLKQKHKKGLTTVKGDIRDFERLLVNVKDVDTMFHCAAQTAVTTSVKNPVEDFEINALGTFNVLEAARQSNTDPIVIFCSTNKVYGNNVNKIPLVEKKTRYEFADPKYKDGIPEDFPTDADEHTPYGCSKYTGDLYMRDFHDIFGLRTVVLRLSCVYGPLQHGTSDQGWLSHFIISGIFGKPVVIYGDGRQVRDILYITDLARLFELIVKNIKKISGKVYNVGGGSSNTISLLELIQFLKGRLGLELKYSFSKWRPADQRAYYSNITKVKKDLGWSPSVSKEEGIVKTHEWIMNNRHMIV
ncbi:MAG: GDP-mannose 4,6-dehydratase [Candidatus Aenigmarchaeota archaeon]|nr:GDP-mannose 4,6-dehydratase [Candidatus Aenigmarchaeota archaeon]